MVPFFMNPTGSFASAIGGSSPELQAAIQRRATQGGTTNQVSNTAPTFDPNTQPSAPPTAGSPNSPQSSHTDSPKLPFESPEAKMLVGAMSHRLKSLSKLQGA